MRGFGRLSCENDIFIGKYSSLFSMNNIFETSVAFSANDIVNNNYCFLDLQGVRQRVFRNIFMSLSCYLRIVEFCWSWSLNIWKFQRCLNFAISRGDLQTLLSRLSCKLIVIHRTCNERRDEKNMMLVENERWKIRLINFVQIRRCIKTRLPSRDSRWYMLREERKGFSTFFMCSVKQTKPR